MNQEPSLRRNPAMDLIRCVALFSLISLHFFLNSGFYSHPILGKRMFLMTLIRSASMVCVPLFMLLSGYLMCEKKISKNYYFGINKTIGIYVLASLACIFYKCVFLKKKISALDVFLGILDFSAADYSWYIELYLGLFLMIPFLNVLYRSLESKKQKSLLILTALFLTALPSVTNIYNFRLEGFWRTPSLATTYTKLIPAWWGRLYPLTYYLIACYFREFGLKIKTRTNVLLLLASVLCFGSFCYYRSYGVAFISGEYQAWGSLPNVILSVLLFVLLAHCKLEKLPESCKKLLAKLSSLCLGAYLLSFIFDSAFYGKLNAAVSSMPQRLNYYILIVPLVFLCSLALSALINQIYDLLRKFRRKKQNLLESFEN